MLASLPSTIGKEKHGPKLMAYVSGEAEALLEHLGVEDICSEGGDQKIWKIMDEKYSPQPIDLLQEGLRGFFYELQVKQGESFRQFSARFTAAQRKLEEQKVTLPEVVQGFLFMKKLKLDAQHESMLLTMSGGKLELSSILHAMNAIFPVGKGGMCKANVKDVYQAETEEFLDEEEELQQAMEMLADDIQAKEDWQEEDILEAFESYTEIRKKLQDQKIGRGYFQKGNTGKGKGKHEGFKFSGSISGRIDQLKQRTKCHHCHRYGHWKKECPLKATSSTSTGTSSGKEVLIVEENDPRTRHVWEAFMMEETPESASSWDHNLANDVLNTGNADTHSTGNQQILYQSHEGCGPERRLEQPFEVFRVEEELRARETDPILGLCGIPDTACRRTSVGSGTLALIEGNLSKKGLKVQKARVSNEFRFGNNGVLTSDMMALIPAVLGGKRFIIKAAVLPKEGENTPLLLSKELLRQLGCVINLGTDSAVFSKFGFEMGLSETKKGHYAIPLFNFGKAEVLMTDVGVMMDDGDACSATCFKPETVGKPKEKTYHISDLEEFGSNSLSESGPCPVQEHPVQDHGLSPCADVSGQLSGSGGFGRDLSHVGGAPDEADHSDSRDSGRLSRQHRRSGGQSNQPGSAHDGGQVQSQLSDHVGSVQGGQRLCQVVSEPHRREISCHDETVQDFHRLCGQEQDGPNQRREQVPGMAESGANSSQCQGPSQEQASEEFGNTGESNDPCPGGGERDGLGPHHECRRAGSQESGEGELGVHDYQSSGSRRDGQPAHPGQNGQPSPCHGDDLQGHEVNYVMSRKVRRYLQKNVQIIQSKQPEATTGGDETGRESWDVCTVDVGLECDVSEVFSVPRICPLAEQRGLKSGKSYDIRNGWNFLRADHRKSCLQEIRENRPKHVHVCPPCGPYSQLQQLTENKRDPEVVRRERVEAEVLLRFALQVCEEQRSHGRHYSFEHPKRARSWGERVMVDFVEKWEPYMVELDQCMFGLKDPESQGLYQKGTRLMTSNEFFGKFLGKSVTILMNMNPLKGEPELGEYGLIGQDVHKCIPELWSKGR